MTEKKQAELRDAALPAGPKLSLWQIGVELTQLDEYHQDIEQRILDLDVAIRSLPEQDPYVCTLKEQRAAEIETRNVVEQQMYDYIKREVQKVPNIIAFRRRTMAWIDAAKKERDRIAQIIESLEARKERFDRSVMDGILSQNTKKIIGDDGQWIAVRQNSVYSVTVEDPDAVPPEYRKVTVTMSAATLQMVKDLAPGMRLHVSSGKPEYYNTQIVEDTLQNTGSPIPGIKVAKGEHLRTS